MKIADKFAILLGHGSVGTALAQQAQERGISQDSVGLQKRFLHVFSRRRHRIFLPYK